MKRGKERLGDGAGGPSNRLVATRECVTCTEPVRLESRGEKECETLLAGNRGSALRVGFSEVALYIFGIFTRARPYKSRARHTRTLFASARSHRTHTIHAWIAYPQAHIVHARARTSRPLFSRARSKASRIIDQSFLRSDVTRHCLST